MTRFVMQCLGACLVLACPAEAMGSRDLVLVTMMSQSLREMGFNMGHFQRLTKDDLLEIQPDDVKVFRHPELSGEANTMSFAMTTGHPVGEQHYDRSAAVAARDRLPCKSFYDADAAQQNFLDAGGPEVDRHGLDRDGDGYACGWDPVIYRHFLRDALTEHDSSAIDIIFAGPGHFDN